MMWARASGRHADRENDRVVRLCEQLQAGRAERASRGRRGRPGCERAPSRPEAVLGARGTVRSRSERGRLSPAARRKPSLRGRGRRAHRRRPGRRGRRRRLQRGSRTARRGGEVLGLDEPDVGSVALEPPDLDRPSPLVREHAGALAEELRRADPRARAAEEVLGEDQLGGVRRVALRDRRHETGDVDVRGAGDRAGRGSMGAAALEAAVRFDPRLVGAERRLQLVEEGAVVTDVTRPGEGRRAARSGPGRSAGARARRSSAGPAPLAATRRTSATTSATYARCSSV